MIAGRAYIDVLLLLIVHLVLSDKCELVSVWHECCGFMQYKVDAIL